MPFSAQDRKAYDTRRRKGSPAHCSDHSDPASALNARCKELLRRAWDQTLSHEARLLALLTYDAIIFKRRAGQANNATGGEPDKIEIAKTAHNKRAAARDKIERRKIRGMRNAS